MDQMAAAGRNGMSGRCSRPAIGAHEQIVAALVFAAFLLLVIVPSASALTLGVGWSGDPGNNNSEMPIVAKSGASTFRVPISSGDDGLVEAAAKSGVTIHAEVSTGHTLPTGTDRSNFINSVYTTVTKFGYEGTFWKQHPELPYRPITTWEVFNEPNLWEVSASSYGQFLNEVANSIQAASQSQAGRKTDVLSAGLLILGTIGSAKPFTYYGALKYLEEAYAQFGSNTNVTGVAIHPYEIYPDTFPGLSRIDAFKAAAAGFHNKLVELAKGGAQKSLWITEAGWPVEGPDYPVTTADQASLLREAVDYVRGNEASLNVKDFLWYNFRDLPGTESWDNYCGLRAHDGSFRPAWTAFQEKAGVAQVIPAQPSVQTSVASEVGAFEARLNGSVNPGNLSTGYQFEYGTTSSYGTSIPLPAGSAGEGGSAISESAAITRLSPGTTYHFRIVASNAMGTAYGSDVTLHTPGYRFMRGLSSGTAISSWESAASMSLPAPVAAADFTGDGKADLVAVHSNGNGNYRYMLGTSSGAGISSWTQILSGMSLPSRMAVGDFTGDGKADIVSVEPEGNGKYRYMLGVSSGVGISSWTMVLPGMGASEFLDLGDFTGDGKADIVSVESEGNGNYRFMLGTSSGAGVSVWSPIMTNMSGPYFFNLGDFNGDGKADIVSLESEGANKYRYMLGVSGGGGISSWTAILSGMGLPRQSDLADLTGDGKADVISLETESTGSYAYRLGVSAGSTISNWNLLMTWMRPSSAADVGDFDGDKKADIVSVESEGNGKYRYALGTTGAQGITAKWTAVLSGMSLPSRMAVGDFTGDGKADIVSVEPEGNGKYRYMLGTSSGAGISSWTQILPGMSLPSRMAVGDFTGDGKADLVSVEPEGNGKYRYMLGTSSGAGISSWNLILPGMSNPDFLDLGDFNGDGKADLVAAEPEGNGKYRFMRGISSGAGVSTWTSLMTNMGGPSFFNVGDLNADGKADLVSLEAESN